MDYLIPDLLYTMANTLLTAELQLQLKHPSLNWDGSLHDNFKSFCMCATVLLDSPAFMRKTSSYQIEIQISFIIICWLFQLYFRFAKDCLLLCFFYNSPYIFPTKFCLDYQKTACFVFNELNATISSFKHGILWKAPDHFQ